MTIQNKAITIAILGSGSSSVAAAVAIQHESARSKLTKISVDILDFGLIASSPDLNVLNSKIKASKSLSRKSHVFETPKNFKTKSLLSGYLAGSAAFGGWSNVWGGTQKPYTKNGLAYWASHEAEVEAEYNFLKNALSSFRSTLNISTPARILPQFVKPMSIQTDSGAISELSASNLLISNFASDINVGCTQCGLCLQGCPKGHIWSANNEWKFILTSSIFKYHNGIWIERISEDKSGVTIFGRQDSGQNFEKRYDRVFVGLGALQSGALMLRSGIGEKVVRVRESGMSIVPFVDRRLKSLSKNEQRISLCDAFLSLIQPNTSQDHDFFAQLYGYSDELDLQLIQIRRELLLIPGVLRRRLGKHIGIAMSFFDQDLSSSIKLQLDELGNVVISPQNSNANLSSTRKQQIASAFRAQGLIPLSFAIKDAPIGHSYHLGASFPFHEKTSNFGNFSDELGRPNDMKRIHLIDSSSLPHVTAMPITWTTMANSARIARRSLVLLS